MTATSSKQQPPSSWPILSMPSQCSQTCKTRERFAQNWSQKSPPSSLPLRPSYCSQSCRQSGDLLRIGDTQPHIKIRQPLTPFPFHRSLLAVGGASCKNIDTWPHRKVRVPARSPLTVCCRWSWTIRFFGHSLSCTVAPPGFISNCSEHSCRRGQRFQKSPKYCQRTNSADICAIFGETKSPSW